MSKNDTTEAVMSDEGDWYSVEDVQPESTFNGPFQCGHCGHHVFYRTPRGWTGAFWGKIQCIHCGNYWVIARKAADLCEFPA
jgi:hypothetical protein